MVRTHRLELGLSPPAREGLAEPKRCALDGLRGVPPREVFHMRREVRSASRDVKKLAKGGEGRQRMSGRLSTATSHQRSRSRG